MSERFAVSPFGGKGLVRAQFAVNERVIRARQALRDQGAAAQAQHSKQGGKEGHDKWQLIRAVTEARAALQLSDRTIVVLEALVSFFPERRLDAGRPLIVFPSNAELSLRTRGMAPATLRRHLVTLVEAGLVLRRDSANGKRFACRDAEGRIETAFGFDLSPLAVRAEEIARLAAEARARTAAIRALRSEVTIHLRDISALLRTARAEGRALDLARFEERLAALSGRLGRNTDAETLQARKGQLVALRAEIERAWLSSAPAPELAAVNDADETPAKGAETRKVSANDAQSERHIERSDSEDSYKYNIEVPESADRAHDTSSGKVDSCQRSERPAGHQPKQTPAPQPAVALSSVLAACPRIADYAPGGILGWRDLAKAADLVRTMLGISGETWFQARHAMGDIDAAIVIAAMLERAEELKSPGAYLRSLSKRATIGGFSPEPMLRALLSARLRKEAAANAADPEPAHPERSALGRSRVTETNSELASG
ncbi:plasmid replication protein RepC [Nitratireductor sp. GCM10026969]|uniref:plasmid replication protein RepC n=1 Tax=Nitratireductor sp. GCM10026969 TaxID=3252645 RepID=UPI0036092920